MSKYMKKIVSRALVTTLALTPMGVWAQEGDNQIMPPSPWAMEALLDAEAYGILPKDFTRLQSPVTEAALTYIVEGVGVKLEALGFPKVSIPKEIATFKDFTKEAVLIRLYNELMQFDFSEKFIIDAKSPIDWMKSRGIVKGNETGLNLDSECTLEEALTFATRLIEDIYTMSDQGAKGLIWEVSKGNNKVYLLGTIHMGKPILYPIHESLDKAFMSADTIAFEVDFNNQADMQYLMEQQMFTDGTTLKDHVSEEAYKEVIQLVMPLGLTEEQVNQYKPMTLTNMITMLSAGEESVSELSLPVLDLYFQSKTGVLGKEIVELEGIRYQTDFLYNAPMDTQVFMLEDMVKGAEQSEDGSSVNSALINEWIRLWAAGDEENFAKAFPKNEKTGVQIIDDFNEELFDKRDKHMTDKVVQMLNSEEEKTYMVIVGAGHMIGKTGIVTALQELGYNVSQYK